ALMRHMYSVEGDFDLMIHWDEFFGAARSGTQDSAGNTAAGADSAGSPGAAARGKNEVEPKTNMMLLLAPWIVFWIAASIDGFWGSLVSVTICVLLPVLMHRTKATLYDQISGLGVGACSIALLAGAPPILVIPTSYLLFGLIWTLSCFAKVPLTAHYSKNNYNGDAALRNPIFMRTNRILTAAWGILYLVTPIWTYFIMQTDAASFVGAINSVLPALMGVFTAWFQKWYPRHIARG
ncbi:hypothetical protein, partial [Ellagibacter isourolithinifaciens]|uniref:hypothetical protein n=1 Tax=Ellagibacter isourolithinifaciens TaxID=2137581 RepID=UPI0023F0FE2D